MANSYVEPTTATSLNTGRIQINEALRAVLTNFKSTGIPGSAQISIDGVAVGEQDGMLYRSATTNALYISDSVYGTSSPIGGKFTRRGIGNRIESSFSVLQGSSTLRNLYEVGELVGVLDTGKLYLKTTSTGLESDFKDVGTTQGYTVDVNSNATFTGQSINAIRVFATSNVGIGTTTPTQALDVRGNTYISGNIGVGVTPSAKLDINGNAQLRAAGTLLLLNSDNTNSYYLQNNGVSGSANPVLDVIQNGVGTRMRIDASGNVGIGTTSPSTKLMVVGDTGLDVRNVAQTDALGITASGGFSDFTLKGQTNAYRFFSGPVSGTTERMRIDASGNVGIGTSSATQKLHVVGSILATSDITAYSDERLKSGISTIDNALDKVSAMRGVYFTKDGKLSTGVIAQEIEKVLPEVVTDGEYKSVAYGNIVGILIEAIKELKCEIKELKELK